MTRLTARQARFVDEYLLDLNATQAAIRAGYSARNAGKIGSELLGKTRICEAIQKARNARSARLCRTADDIARDTFETGREARAAGNFSAAIRALELEARLLGLFGEKQDAAMPAIAPEEAYNRALEVYTGPCQ